MSPPLRRRSGRLAVGRDGNQKDHIVEPLHQNPQTPPLMHKFTVLKRRRSSSSQGFSPSKAPRQGGHDGIKFDSEGFEIVEPIVFPTPSTVEILNSRGNERGPTSGQVDFFDSEEPSRFDHPYASEICGKPTTAGVRSPESSETTEHAASPSTPDRRESLCRQDETCSEYHSEVLLKPDFSGDDVPDLSPNTYIYVRNLGLHSPDGSFSEHWAHYPVSFIPSTSLLGPRDLDAGHYNCPYPGCVAPFGPSVQPDGYTGRGLALHIYRRHGYGPAVDRVRLDLHIRVKTLRNVSGKESDDVPIPCCWVDPGRELNRVTAGLIKDLEEISRWERTRGGSIRKNDNSDSLASTPITTQPAVPRTDDSSRATSEREGKGKRRAVTLRVDGRDPWTDSLKICDRLGLETELEMECGSPSIRARMNIFARSRDNRFERPRGASLLHLKEACRTPKKKKSAKRDSSGHNDRL